MPSGPKPRAAAAMVELGLVELEDDPLRGRVRSIGVGRVDVGIR